MRRLALPRVLRLRRLVKARARHALRLLLALPCFVFLFF